MNAVAAVETVNPSTGERVERIAYTAPNEVDARLERAQSVQRAWRSTSAQERAQVLRGLAARLRERRDRLAEIAVREMGKPVVQARAEVEKCATACEYFAERASSMLADEPAQTNARRSYVAFRPLGVVLAIMPWNFPYWQTFRAGIPALVAGNTLLLKHAASTTRCALETEALFDGLFDAGPLLQTLVVTDEYADELIADARVNAVTLTGSGRAGVAVAAAAGRALKKCVLELGGSDAFIILRDAGVERAVATAVTARFQNNGQSCIAAKRFIVEQPLYEEFLDRFATSAQALRVGDPMEEATQLGPCARADLRASVDRQVHATLERGARLRCGGRATDRPGFFYEATLVSDVAPGMAMFDEEVFGPAAAAMPARDAEDALRIANASQFGLACAIWTRDAERAQRLAQRVEAGSVFINGMVASDPRLPFGGVKASGFGRELSHFGVHEFANAQSVWVGPGT